jgi:hypothetical protein
MWCAGKRPSTWFCRTRRTHERCEKLAQGVCAGRCMQLRCGGCSFADMHIQIEPKSGRRRPNHLRIKTNISPDQNPLASGTLSAPYNAALANAASNLQIAFNEMLRSPAPMSAAACARTVSVQNKPLPRRPRSISAPSTPTLPVELPGSLLQVNQGFPLSVSRTVTPALSATESTTPKEDSSPNSDLILGQDAQ